MMRILFTWLLLLLLLNHSEANAQLLKIGTSKVNGITSPYGMITQNLYDSLEIAIAAVVPNVGTAYTFIPSDQQVATTVAQGVSPVNQIRFWRFRLRNKIILTSISFNLATGGTGKFVNIGIYNFNGTIKKIDTGAISATGGGLKTISVAGTTLIPGDYIIVWTSDATAVQFTSTDKATNQNLILNAGVPQLGSCQNVSVAGVLPSTLGTLTGQDYNESSVGDATRFWGGSDQRYVTRWSGDISGGSNATFVDPQTRGAVGRMRGVLHGTPVRGLRVNIPIIKLQQ